VCYTPQRRNLQDFEALVEWAARAGISLFNVSQFVPVGRGDHVEDLSPEQWRKFFDRWIKVRQVYVGQINFRSHLAQLALADPSLAARPEFSGCAAGRGQGCITPEGCVTPCVLIPITIGDLKRQSFAEIWSSSPLIRRLQAPRRFGGRCASCRFLEKCGGCRASALAEGNLWGEDPHCWILE
jgi:radical SAM protein with 4Fe4S-binding SPASM domain